MGEVPSSIVIACKKLSNIQSAGEAAVSAAPQLRTGGEEHREVHAWGGGRGAGCGEMSSKGRNQRNAAQSISWFLSTTTDPHPGGFAICCVCGSSNAT